MSPAGTGLAPILIVTRSAAKALAAPKVESAKSEVAASCTRVLRCMVVFLCSVVLLGTYPILTGNFGDSLFFA
jgi:hypothetical protein